MSRADITGPFGSPSSAGSVAVWICRSSTAPPFAGKGCTSADAAGFPRTAMLATSDEVAAGRVGHALRFILPDECIRDGISSARDALDRADVGGPDTPPYGVRLRLKASFDTSGLSAGAEGARAGAQDVRHVPGPAAATSPHDRVGSLLHREVERARRHEQPLARLDRSDRLRGGGLRHEVNPDGRGRRVRGGADAGARAGEAAGGRRAPRRRPRRASSKVRGSGRWLCPSPKGYGRSRCWRSS